MATPAPFSNRIGRRQYVIELRMSDSSSLDVDADQKDDGLLEEGLADETQAQQPHINERGVIGKRKRIKHMFSRNDRLDKQILTTAIPSMINLAVVPLVNSVDVFWVGRLGNAPALAGQSAANTSFFTFFFLVSYLGTITAPLVATAVGSGNQEEARDRVCEALFLSNLFGLLGTLLLAIFPDLGLSMILPDKTAPALQYARPYLRVRALSMIPALFASVAFAAFRGSLDTVTPLKVSLATNLVNLVLDPVLIFFTPLRVAGAAVATALAETLSGLVYLKLLVRRNLANLRQIVRIPKWQSLVPLILGSLSMLGRQAALNFGFVCAARRAQSMDSTGVAAAAYGIVMQVYVVGIVMHVAMQGAAAALVPANMAKSGEDDARRVGDRMFVWCSLVGILLGVTQLLALPWLVPLFSTLPEVQQAVRMPALIASFLHLVNGPGFAGEGVMLGLRCFRGLMLITAAGVGIFVAGLSSPLGSTLNGIFLSQLVFSSYQALAVSWHYLKIGPLSLRKGGKLKEVLLHKQ